MKAHQRGGGLIWICHPLTMLHQSKLQTWKKEQVHHVISSFIPNCHKQHTIILLDNRGNECGRRTDLFKVFMQ